MNVAGNMPVAYIEDIKEMEIGKAMEVMKDITGIADLICPADHVIAAGVAGTAGMLGLPTCLTAMPTMVEEDPAVADLAATLQLAQSEAPFRDQDIDLPPLELFEEPDGDDESCDYEYDDCPNKVEYWVSPWRLEGNDKWNRRYYCPKHFALRLHSIINDMHSDQWISGQENRAKRREAIHTYFFKWGRIG